MFTRVLFASVSSALVLTGCQANTPKSDDAKKTQADTPKSDDAKKTQADAPKTDDAKEIQGTWRIVSLSVRGEKPAEDLDKSHIKFKESQMFVDVEGELAMYKFRLNTAKKPREIDLLAELTEKLPKGKEGKAETFLLRGIYELNGDDLKLCWKGLDEKASLADKRNPRVRPTEFKGGDDIFLIHLKRDK